MLKKAKPTPPENLTSRGKVEKLLKWVGGVTAVLSLIFALHKFVEMVSDVRERQRQIAEFYEVGKRQQANADYAGAWNSFEEAMKAAEPGGQLAKLTAQLGEQRLQLRQAQEDLAMEWLRNIRTSQGQTFSDIVAQLAPVLERGIVSAAGPRKADLLAHVGWADFLRWREGRRDLTPEQQYRLALEIDPANPYAHAHWGHWQFWRRENIEDAKAHFSAALASGRARDYVRKMQLAAAKNLGPDGDATFLAAINDMRKNNEPIAAQTRTDLYSIYHFTCASRFDAERFEKLLTAVPAAEQIATFRALFYGLPAQAGEHADDFDQWKRPGRDACLAALLEAAGQPEEALQIWQQLFQTWPAEGSGSLGDRAREAIKRLSPGQ